MGRRAIHSRAMRTRIPILHQKIKIKTLLPVNILIQICSLKIKEDGWEEKEKGPGE